MVCFPYFFCTRVGYATAYDEEVSGIQNVKIYKYKELQGATDDFSPENKIGQGGFGSVYKGTLKNGKVAAIKVLSAESKQGVKEFLAEINAIACIQHENLVKLYGCCVEGNQRMLVYNYLENNSLSRTLLGSSSNQGINFTWEARKKICVGIACGIAFLHEEVSPHIIHRDIKASNILLDSDLTPKISDFGLAKLFPDNVTHVSTRVAGTIGYLAPEYAVRGRLSEKADVYSFGVLLMEIVSGRHNMNSRLPIKERFLLPRVWQYYDANELVLVVDEDLDGLYDAEQACRILKIALLCTQDDPRLRPSMSTVVKMLNGEIGIDTMEIHRPGLLSDLTQIRIKNAAMEKKPKEEEDHMMSESENNISSSSENMEDLSSSVPSTYAAMMLSSYDHSQ